RRPPSGVPPRSRADELRHPRRPGGPGPVGGLPAPGLAVVATTAAPARDNRPPPAPARSAAPSVVRSLQRRRGARKRGLATALARRPAPPLPACLAPAHRPPGRRP